MSGQSTYLTILAGPVVPIPVPYFIGEALASVEVSHSDNERSGAQLSFSVGRGGVLGTLDYPTALYPLFTRGNRIILILTLRSMPYVIFDGLISHHQLAPSNKPGESTFTVTCEDVSLAMDLEEIQAEHPAQPDVVVVTKLILKYARYGLVPYVVPPKFIDLPLPIERIPTQRGTDYQHIQSLAAKQGYVFSVMPTPIPGVNLAYWGPPSRVALLQPALSINLGPESNLESIQFEHDMMAPEFVDGWIQDGELNLQLPIMTFASTRFPLSALPTWLYPFMRRTVLPEDTSGQNYLQAFAQAQARTDRSTDHVVKARGQVDTALYGHVLFPRLLVGVRGAGLSYDGLYYVDSVNHSIKRGEYKQHFSISRDGIGSLTPVVLP